MPHACPAAVVPPLRERYAVPHPLPNSVCGATPTTAWRGVAGCGGTRMGRAAGALRVGCGAAVALGNTGDSADREPRAQAPHPQGSLDPVHDDREFVANLPGGEVKNADAELFHEVVAGDGAFPCFGGQVPGAGIDLHGDNH